MWKLGEKPEIEARNSFYRRRWEDEQVVGPSRLTHEKSPTRRRLLFDEKVSSNFFLRPGHLTKILRWDRKKLLNPAKCRKMISSNFQPKSVHVCAFCRKKFKEIQIAFHVRKYGHV